MQTDEPEDAKDKGRGKGKASPKGRGNGRDKQGVRHRGQRAGGLPSNTRGLKPSGRTPRRDGVPYVAECGLVKAYTAASAERVTYAGTVCTIMSCSAERDCTASLCTPVGCRAQ